jgi:hypothetical protein
VVLIITDDQGSGEVAEVATLELDLEPTGHAQFQTWLNEADGKSRGARYTTVRRLE